MKKIFLTILSALFLLLLNICEACDKQDIAAVSPGICNDGGGIRDYAKLKKVTLMCYNQNGNIHFTICKGSKCQGYTATNEEIAVDAVQNSAAGVVYKLLANEVVKGKIDFMAKNK